MNMIIDQTSASNVTLLSSKKLEKNETLINEIPMARIDGKVNRFRFQVILKIIFFFNFNNLLFLLQFQVIVRRKSEEGLYNLYFYNCYNNTDVTFSQRSLNINLTVN